MTPSQAMPLPRPLPSCEGQGTDRGPMQPEAFALAEGITAIQSLACLLGLLEPEPREDHEPQSGAAG